MTQDQAKAFFGGIIGRRWGSVIENGRTWIAKCVRLPKNQDENIVKTPSPGADMSEVDNQVGTKSCTTLDISSLWYCWKNWCTFPAFWLPVKCSLRGSISTSGDGSVLEGIGGGLGGSLLACLSTQLLVIFFRATLWSMRLEESGPLRKRLMDLTIVGDDATITARGGRSLPLSWIHWCRV